MSTVKNCHGLEIRGSEKPNVQGTQESNWKAARHSLNVASAVGFLCKPPTLARISNPWLLPRPYISAQPSAHFLTACDIDRLTRHVRGFVGGEEDRDVCDVFIRAAAPERHLRLVFCPHLFRRQALRFRILV